MKAANVAILMASGAPWVLADYVWPSQHDFLEDLLAMQTGYIRFGFTDLVVPCGFGSNTPGKQTSAEWIRTAFHDFATHDAAAGTGGLDASIMYEVSRAENEGAAFNNTLSEMHGFVTPRSSAADLIALALVASVASCGGKPIPLRAGRVDAAGAGPSGVPKPDDGLDSTVAAFARAGFDVPDMIALTACGHTVGGVHSVDFPAIAPGEPSDENVAHFDGTTTAFDTDVVEDYFSANGSNPLAFGANATTNSDARVFAADGTNETMAALRDPDTFQKTCADLFERMIDTVPAGVTLSEPIQLIDVKPYINKFEPVAAANGSALAFEGRIRVRTTGKDAQSVSVALDVRDRAGKTTRVQAPRAVLRGGLSYGFFGEEFAWFEFSTELDVAPGVEGFDVVMTAENGTVEVFDNAGTGGYPIEDGLLYVQGESCLDATVKDGNMTVTVRAGVREDLDRAGEVPAVKLAHNVQQQGVMLPRLAVEATPMVKEATATKGGAFETAIASF
ncbi:putative l-ascorbate oxidase protein [Neofusicoccum parvum]|nr:putative l-ascorbate oxidase protein [Neofusicoccum parvum]